MIFPRPFRIRTPSKLEDSNPGFPISHRISSTIPQLTYLCLDLSGITRIKVHHVPALPKLTDLRLVLDPEEKMVLHQISNFLRAALTLSTFVWQFAAPIVGDGQVVRPDALAVSTALKQIEFCGYIDSKNVVDLGNFVRVCAPELANAIVHLAGNQPMVVLAFSLQ
ncbi:hypothetical protein TB2_005732 [Malus domestica]